MQLLPRSDCVDAQADLSLRCPHIPWRQISHGTAQTKCDVRKVPLTHSSKKACTFAQSDQGLSYPLIESMSWYCRTYRWTEAPIRLSVQQSGFMCRLVEACVCGGGGGGGGEGIWVGGGPLTQNFILMRILDKFWYIVRFCICRVYSHPLLFTLYFSSKERKKERKKKHKKKKKKKRKKKNNESPFYYMWICVKLLIGWVAYSVDPDLRRLIWVYTPSGFVCPNT